MKIGALALIFVGSLVQAGGTLFAVILRKSSEPVAWMPLAAVMGVGVALAVAGVSCLAGRATQK